MDNLKSEIVGVWSLESFVIIDENNKTKNWGDNVHGTLIYTDSGYMSLNLNRQLVPSGHEFKDIYEAVYSYSGSYTLSDGKVIHTVTESSDPIRINQSLTRYIMFNGDKLQISSPQESFGVAILVWKKLTQKNIW